MNWKEYKVDIADIAVNPKYQRPLNEAWVKKIVKNFDDSKVNQIILSATPEGKYYVVDGQHTIEAVKRVNGEHTMLPAKIFFNLTEQEEADLFYTYNTERKVLSPNDKIRARYARGEADVVDYFDALGYTDIKYTLDGKTKDSLNNHATCIKVFSAVSRDSAVRAMLCYKDAAINNDPTILSGLMWLINRHAEIDDDRLCRKMSQTSRAEFTKLMFDIGVSTGYSPKTIAGHGVRDRKIATKTRVAASAIAYLYNKGGKKNFIDLATV